MATQVNMSAFWLDEAWGRDERDPLAPLRDRFFIPPDSIYLDGNSLGLLSRDAHDATLAVLAQWQGGAIEGWTDPQNPWYTLAETLAADVAALVGAAPECVAVTGSTTVNIHQCVATLFRPDHPAPRILADALSFPSDIYALESFLRGRGLDPATCLVKVPSRDGRTLRTDDIIAALDGVQMALLPSVIYTSGQLLDMATITRAARERDVVIGWDLSHSVGVVPHELDSIGADFAVWCHYKYVNAGPGAVAGLYLNRRHHDTLPGLAGWWGSDKIAQFAMRHEFTPAGGAGSLQIGTPHILSLAPLQGSLAVFRDAGGVGPLRAKSLALTGFLRRLVEAHLTRYGVGIATPSADDARGGHLALTHPDAAALCRALRRIGVVPDFRPPDIIRLAPAPLYTRFVDCLNAHAALYSLLKGGEWREADNAPELVP